MDLLNSPEFSAHVEEVQEKWHIPGIAIAVVQGDRTASKGFGKASLDPPKPCTPDTIFDIASVSKNLTAASVAVLIDDNEKYPDVQWDATMSSLLPDDFVMTGEGYTENVTVEDMLSHRTGLPTHDSTYLGIHAEHPDTAETVTRNLRNLEVSEPIRSKFMYCNLMFTVATHLVEKKTGQSFEDFIHTHFFKPLDMPSTNLQPGSAKAAGLGDRIAGSYIWEEKKSQYKEIPILQTPEDQGAGSILTSVNDYIKYVKAILNREGPFTEEVYKGLIKPRICENPEDDNIDPFTSWTMYAAGFETYYYRGHLVVQHDGRINGFGSTLFFMPQLNFGGVVFGNSGSATSPANFLGRELMDAALKIPLAERVNWNDIYLTRRAKWEKQNEEEGPKVRKALWPEYDGEAQEHTTSLSSYTGNFSNAGYHKMTVEVKDNQLFIDASDRCMGFYLKFEHLCDQTKFVALLIDCEDDEFEEPLEAEFELEGERAVRMGLKMDPDLESYIRFDRIE